ncbi:hypothetical protein FLA_4359 [Filimonas lacunae]|nr:hypothetical protein FLA_4359 [Filimonas lacunae]
MGEGASAIYSFLYLYKRRMPGKFEKKRYFSIEYIIYY